MSLQTIQGQMVWNVDFVTNYAKGQVLLYSHMSCLLQRVLCCQCIPLGSRPCPAVSSSFCVYLSSPVYFVIHIPYKGEHKLTVHAVF